MNHETFPLLSGTGTCSDPGDTVPSSAIEPAQTPRWLNLVLFFVGLFMLYDAGVFTFAWLLFQGESVIEASSYGGRFLFLSQLGAVAFLLYVLYRRRRAGLDRAGLSADSRWFLTLELVLVVFVSFGVSIASSIQVLTFEYGIPLAEHHAWSYDVYRMLDSAAMLGAFAYVLCRGPRNPVSIGLHWRGRDFAMALPLGIAGIAVSYLWHPLSQWVAESLAGHSLIATHNASEQANFSVSMPWIVFLFLNGFDEELIVRAFLMTQVRKLTNSAALAIALSVAVQVSYHFYQGAPAALGHVGWALLFSLYYWKTNRILPVVLAHNFNNFTGLLMREL